MHFRAAAPMTVDESTAVMPHQRLAQLMDGYLVTQLLRVVVALRIPDLLAQSPQSSESLAAATGADRMQLYRMLRRLVVEDVLTEDDDGCFGLTEVGAQLCEGPRSLAGGVTARGELYYEAAARLLEAARSRRSAFECVHGEAFFEHLDRHPGRDEAFQASMLARSQLEAADVVAAYDFRRFRRLVDVGGGQGILLRAILEQASDLTAVLFDRPVAVEQARSRLSEGGIGDRCELVSGDFFESLPTGADAYLLSRVIHDWDDDDARRILRSCRRSMETGATLLLVETILPQRAHDGPAAVVMDLNMLLLFGAGARERTETEFQALLSAEGFEGIHVVPTRSRADLSVIEAVAGPGSDASGAV